jgi:signal transduction histidine kinase
MEMIESGAERLARIVDDILVAGQLEAGQLQLAVTRCDADAVARGVVSAARLTAPARIDLELAVPDALPPVLADPDKVAQVLGNLVENAVKYSPDGGLVVVRLEEREPRTLRLSVEDEGLGVPPADRERIFEKFYRLDPNLTRGVRGSGLGLYVCRELLARMDGEIWMEPRAGKGSTFIVELPLADD